MENVNAIKAAIAAAVGVLTALWGWFGWLVVAWVACMTIDYLTGNAAAWKHGKWSSKVARQGLWHKAGCIVVVIAAGILDAVAGGLVEQAGLAFHYSVLLCPMAVVWYILMELGSIVENVGAMGAPLPAFLVRAIEILQDTVDQAGDHLTDKED